MKLLLASVFIGLLQVGSISVQDGRGLFPDMGETINLFSSNTNSTGILSTKCQGKADCLDGTVTEVIDGDTLDVNNVRIRLALIDAPENNESGYSEARHFVESWCKVGTQAKVDEDDRQKGGSFGRMIALVYCANNSISINEAILGSGFATIYREFCNISEFATGSWATKYCSEKESLKEQLPLSPSVAGNESRKENANRLNVTEIGNGCDSSYPDFCIPSPPPDLACSDIAKKNFTVRRSDPHGFDLDGNSEGCESEFYGE